MKIVPFSPDHARAIDLQDGQKSEERYLPELYSLAGEAFTGMDGDRIIFCAGRAYGFAAWAMLSRDAGKYMIAITRCVKRLMMLHGEGRLEVLVTGSFPAAHRWMGILGFTRDGEHEGFAVYARGQ